MTATEYEKWYCTGYATTIAKQLEEVFHGSRARPIWQVAQAATIPIIGIGGIMKARDALEFIIAGASAVQVGTANFVNPRATTDILDGLEEFMRENGVSKITELVGTLEV